MFYLYKQNLSSKKLKIIRIIISSTTCVIAGSLTFYTKFYPINHGWNLVYLQSFLVSLTLLLLNIPSGYSPSDKNTTQPLKVLVPISIPIFTHLCSSYELGEFMSAIDQKIKLPNSKLWIYWLIISVVLCLELYRSVMLHISTVKNIKSVEKN